MLTPRSETFISRSILLLLWLVALVLLAGGLGLPVVQRTQEARVLETAREMLTADAHGWVVPRLNGELRLEKPPLAYWLSALSYRALGMNEFAGRLPFVLAAWATLAFTYRISARLMGSQAGFLAAAATFTMFMFFRHARLAETDVLAAMFVTVAVDCFLMAAAPLLKRSTAALLLHLGALACGLAAMAKGPPAMFPLLFLLVWAAVERDWRVIKRFLLTGALLTLALVAGWWFYVISRTPEWDVIRRELDVVTGGERHPGPFYAYFPQILSATAPWSGLFVLGMLWSIRRWRNDRAARALLVWFAAIFIPLSCIGNKQFHYLVPLVPVCGGFVAYAINQALAPHALGTTAALRIVFQVMLALSALSAPAVLAVARMQRRFFTVADLLVALLILCGTFAAWNLYRRHGLVAGLIGYVAAWALAFTAIFGRWYPSLDLFTHRQAARQLHDSFPDARYCFYGKDISYPLVYNMRRIIPRVQSLGELEQLLELDPQRVVISQTKNKQPPPHLPDNLLLRASIELDAGNTLRIYTRP